MAEGGAAVKGVRIPFKRGENGAADQPERWPQNPGDYVGPLKGYTGDLPAVFYLLPNARDPGVEPSGREIHHVVSPPHTFRECEDGSLEVRASIGAKTWHGFLNAGHNWDLEAK